MNFCSVELMQFQAIIRAILPTRHVTIYYFSLLDVLEEILRNLDSEGLALVTILAHLMIR
jgi:hypothetical protein